MLVVLQEGPEAELEGAEGSDLSSLEKQRQGRALHSAWRDGGPVLLSPRRYLSSFGRSEQGGIR